MNATATEIDPPIVVRQLTRASKIGRPFWHSRSLRETESAYKFPGQASSFWGHDCSTQGIVRTRSLSLINDPPKFLQSPWLLYYILVGSDISYVLLPWNNPEKREIEVIYKATRDWRSVRQRRAVIPGAEGMAGVNLHRIQAKRRANLTSS